MSIASGVERFWPKYQDGLIVGLIRVDWHPQHDDSVIGVVATRSHPSKHTCTASHAAALKNGIGERQGELGPAPVLKLDDRLPVEALPDCARFLRRHHDGGQSHG